MVGVSREYMYLKTSGAERLTLAGHTAVGNQCARNTYPIHNTLKQRLSNYAPRTVCVQRARPGCSPLKSINCGLFPICRKIKFMDRIFSLLYFLPSKSLIKAVRLSL
jgi:hypothetical protein